MLFRSDCRNEESDGQLRFDLLLAILKKPVTSSLIPTTCAEPFFASYPLLMAILKPAPISVVSRVDEMSYDDSVLEADRRLMAILELSSHDVVAQRVAKSSHYGQPGFLESEQHSVVMGIRNAIEADLPAIVDIGNQSIPPGWSTVDAQPVAVAGRAESFRKFDPARRPTGWSRWKGRFTNAAENDYQMHLSA